MILNNAPANEAIVSNVSEIGEFRIRNSAKAFSILSSGLYANKVRAIIRELSCNAVDSHTAAGKADTPFDVHLPNSLEPYFSIRDYGTGLSHEQVTQIYTTYFESTKTGSNDFIGALGLGSKSPFSYTDNFTVTAIQNGIKGIYSAFINGDGVPSIAKMMTEETDEPAGVEVKFSVNDRYDFDKFRQEARQVYTHFALRPVVHGSSDFIFHDVDYETKDVIPGVHSIRSGRSSVAVMGNIAYPISIPNADSSLGELRSLLSCGLEMHFGIGELDFQASREGLSYIPETVNAIKAKLEALNAALTVVLKAEADVIENLWERAVFLNKKKEHPLWTVAVSTYAVDAQLPTIESTGVTHQYCRLAKFQLTVESLAKDYNIQLRGIYRSRGSKAVSNMKSETQYGDRDANGHYKTWQAWSIGVSTDTHFVINDLKTGATERAKYHYRETQSDVYQRHVYVIEPANRASPVKTTEFFAAIHNPPAANIVKASGLLQKERSNMGKNVTILSLQRRGGSGYRRDEDDMVWRDAGKSDAFDYKQTYYYIPLSGFSMLSAKGYSSGKEIHEDVKALPGLFSGTIYGVRKTDIEDIKKKANWKNFEDHITQLLTTKDTSKLLMSLVKQRLDKGDIFEYNNTTILGLIDANSPYAKLVSQLVNVEKFKGNDYNLTRLFKKFAPNANLSPDTLVNKYQQELNNVNSRYPLLSKFSTYRVDANDIAEYVNLIDEKKGI